MNTRVFCTSSFKNHLKDCCVDHPSLSGSIDVFIRAHTRREGPTTIKRDVEKVKDLRNSVQMNVMKHRMRTPDAGKGTTYRLIFANNASLLILIDIYPKNEQEKVDLDLINRSMANLPKNCTDLGEPFIEIKYETCKNLVR